MGKFTGFVLRAMPLLRYSMCRGAGLGAASLSIVLMGHSTRRQPASQSSALVKKRRGFESKAGAASMTPDDLAGGV